MTTPTSSREVVYLIVGFVVFASLFVCGKAGCTSMATGMPFGRAVWFTLSGGEVRSAPESSEE